MGRTSCRFFWLGNAGQAYFYEHAAFRTRQFLGHSTTCLFAKFYGSGAAGYAKAMGVPRRSFYRHVSFFPQ
jgi:hypothetical protein